MRSVNYGYTKEERNLIRFSNYVCQDYPDLFEYVKANEKVVRNNIDTNTDKGKALDFLFTRKNQQLSNIISELQKEWVHDDIPSTSDSEKRLVCQLCGQTGLRNLWPLKNRFNQKQLHIGSECIKHYNLGINATEGKSHEEYLYEVALRKKKNHREYEANLKSNRALYRDKVAQSRWNKIAYLPSVEITKEIVNLIQKVIPTTLRTIRDSSQSLNPEILNICDEQVKRLESLLDAAYDDITKPSTDWRVSNAVYSWAKQKDKNRKKGDAEYCTLLERSCNINSDNVALIMEEGHKAECLDRISREFPSMFRIKSFPGQSDRIKIYHSVNGNEYPYWIQYHLLVSRVAKQGFPEVGSLTSFSVKDLISCSASIDLQESRAASLYLQDAIRETGASVIDEDKSGFVYLITKNSRGLIYKLNNIAPTLSVAILTGDNKDLLHTIEKQIGSGNWMSIDAAKENWKEFYRR